MDVMSEIMSWAINWIGIAKTVRYYSENQERVEIVTSDYMKYYNDMYSNSLK